MLWAVTPSTGGKCSLCGIRKSRSKKGLFFFLFFFFFLNTVKLLLEIKTRCWYFGKGFIKNESGHHKWSFAQEFGCVQVCWIHLTNSYKTQGCYSRICGWGTGECGQLHKKINYGQCTPLLFSLIRPVHMFTASITQGCIYWDRQFFHLAGPCSETTTPPQKRRAQSCSPQLPFRPPQALLPPDKKAKMLLFAQPKNRLCLRKIARGKKYSRNTEKMLKDDM